MVLGEEMTTGYRIDKLIPIPKKRKSGIGRTPIYPFGRMKVGDSFFVPIKNATSKRIYNTSYQYTTRHGGSPRFIVRIVEGGCRCWRIEDKVKFPVSPRLSPDGTYYICDHCRREWKPGVDPGCPECAAAWDEIQCSTCGHTLVGGVCPVVGCASASKLI